MADILAASPASDWRTPNPDYTLYLELDGGRVVLELNPALAPQHVQNVLKIVRSGYFHGLPIYRVQDNFVAQWGDASGTRPMLDGAKQLPPEFVSPVTPGQRVTELPDPDGFAPRVGFLDGFPVAMDQARSTLWPAHCYGVLGVGRDNAPDTGSGAELYVVIGHAPRQLDRNITVIGRVIYGMERISALPRGAAPMGMLAEPEQQSSIRELRVAADVAPEERSKLELLRTDSASFLAVVEARRNRRDAWYLTPAGHIDLCNVPLPMRQKP